MAKKTFGFVILAMMLVFGMAVVGCDNDTTNGNNDPTSGRFMIINAPPSQVSIFTPPMPTTRSEVMSLHGSGQFVATGGLSNPAEGAVVRTNTGPFTGSGDFIVLLVFGGGAAVMESRIGTARFINGSATIDFNSMTRFEDLPN